MNTKSIYLCLFVLLASILTACGAPAPTPTAIPTSTTVPTPTSAPVDPATIAQGFWDAMNAKNIDAAMAFVADDVQISGGPFPVSPSENKAEFSAFMSSETKRGVTFEISDLKAISGDTVTFDQKVYDNNGSQLASGLGRFQVNNDGKIILMQFP